MKATALLKCVRRLRATVCLALLLIAAYFFLSNGTLFIERSRLLSLAFSLQQPWNAVFYMFAHLGLQHLAVNVLYVVFFAAIVELALTSIDVLLIFLFSGILTAIVFSALNPGNSLVGGSGAGAALLSSAFLLDLRKTSIALIAIVALFLFLPGAINFLQEQQEAAMAAKTTELQRTLQQAVQEGKSEEAAQIAAAKLVAEKELGEFKESKQLAFKTKTDLSVHAFAAAIGVCYVLLFRRKKFIDNAKQLNALLKRKK